MFRILTAAIVMLAAGPVVADWPEFRGPGGQGHGDGVNLPVSWSSTENVQWKTAVPGLGWSSPVIVNGRIYITTAVTADDDVLGPRQSLRLLCVKSESGEIEWNHEVFQQASVDARVDRVHKKNSHASPTPVIDGDHIFVHFGTHGTACLTLDGEVVWKNQELQYVPVHGNGGSPILVNDLLVVSCDGGDTNFITALDRKTGAIRWKTDRTNDSLAKRFAFGTPLLIEAGGRQQIISQAAGAVFAYRPDDGSVIWKVDYADGYSVIPRPVYAHGLLFISSGYDRPTLFAIDPDGEGDITETNVRWTMKKGAPHTPSPLVVGDEVYVVSDGGIATCLNAVTGEEYWQERLGGNFSASPTFADGKIYFQSEQGEGVVVAPGREYQELGRNNLEPRTFASYAVDGSSLIIRTESSLYRIGR